MVSQRNWRNQAFTLINPRTGLAKKVLRLNAETVLAYQTSSTPYFLGASAWTRAHGVYRSRREFGTRTHCAKNIDGSTIATAAATRIDARSIAAWDDAFAFTFTAG